ncbi:hypothetical protein P153DRAFT_297801 [Dothidotthia symphoricarpi CBS 119687]|uniref:DUF7719 domain-containing protein n=1 Tax=Dothidotthia symphoricarpi CBS 119687 TaxID=1392245 RepID=A0A6A6A6J7_9PLEO|nr:uncharacterized protein P153DRAFT_297801 [Dothidotthia symphoricarpi CBS 119687]KAF2126547.1 hypothetical protein P153DRAFT_297801 [Dothidotthia symphoricarpi CBS 119687]
MAVGNRKERRAQASKPAIQPTTELSEESVNILLQHPDRSGPKGKTLFELAEERQRELDAQNGRVRPPTVSDTATTTATDAADVVSIGPLGDAILYSISMAALHFTLDVIVYNQYREALVWNEIVSRAGTAWPIFGLLVYLMHVDLSYKFPVLRNVGFLAGSVVAGCYLVFSGNQNGYFYVMKAAPPLGVLWIWSVVEMELPYAVASMAVVCGYVWWNGFQVF